MPTSNRKSPRRISTQRPRGVPLAIAQNLLSTLLRFAVRRVGDHVEMTGGPTSTNPTEVERLGRSLPVWSSWRTFHELFDCKLYLQRGTCWVLLRTKRIEKQQELVHGHADDVHSIFTLAPRGARRSRGPRTHCNECGCPRPARCGNISYFQIC